MRCGHLELKTQLAIKDQEIRALGSLLERETSASCRSGRIYGEPLGMALAAHVLGKYAVFGPRTVECKWPVRISAAESWTTFNSNLAEDNGLEELAQLADMSLLLLSIVQTWKSSPSWDLSTLPKTGVWTALT
jgi:hypothetical protein